MADSTGLTKQKTDKKLIEAAELFIVELVHKRKS